jgi:hemerythrin-like metal-binding protein/diguanylate cyclase (GGDEF)-like protein
MPSFEWKPEFSVGIVRFDDDHRHLISLLNQLRLAIHEGQDGLALSFILEGLIWYTQSHFGAEEALMQRYAFPEFASHKAEHDRFRDRVVEFADGFKSGRKTNSDEIATAMEEWLAKHMVECDASYSQFFRSKGVADVALAHESVSRLVAAEENARSHAELLQRSERLALDLSEILELIAGDSALEPVLQKIVRVVRDFCGRDAAILQKINDSLEVMAATGDIPQGICSALSGLSCSKTGFSCVTDVEIPVDGAVPVCAAIVSIHDNAGELLGYMLLLDGSSPAVPPEWDLLRRTARIASIAILHRQDQERIAFASQYDAATGLPNRLLLSDLLEEALVRASREQVRVALLAIQLNQFQAIIDFYGCSAGDCVLKLVTERLKACVPPSCIVARLSGGTFIVVWSGVPDPASAENLARSILRTFRRSFSIAGHSRRITAAIGVAMYPQDASTQGDLIRDASAAMRQGRTPGRNTFQSFTPKAALLLEERLAVEKHLELAIERGELSLVYQPQVDLAGEIAGLEALLRWHNPVLGNISPGVFIPIAEEIGLIPFIDAWVLRQACLQAAKWHGNGARVRIAINISASQFTSADLVEKMRTVLKETCADPSLIELEVTETAVMQNLNEAAAQIEKLRSLGVSMAIDDFGVGYSSLSYLRVLPVDRVKIDRSFLENIESSTDSVAILKAVIQLIHQLGLDAILEGVESAAELKLVAPLHPDLLQGYLFYRPMSSARTGALLSRLGRVSMTERLVPSVFAISQDSHPSL